MGHIGQGEEGLECFETLHWAESQGFLAFVSSAIAAVWNLFQNCSTDGATGPGSKLGKVAIYW